MPDVHPGHHKVRDALRDTIAQLTSINAELREERDRYREHSVTLNSIGWQVAQALGDVPSGATEILGNPVEQVTRLVADRDRWKRLQEVAAEHGAELAGEKKALAAENARLRQERDGQQTLADPTSTGYRLIADAPDDTNAR